MPQASYRQKRYDEKQRQILESAARLFAEKGYGQVSLEEIGAELHLSKASLYYYVKSKDDILFQLHMQAMDQAIAVLERAQASALPPVEKIRTAIRDLVLIATREDILASYRIESRFLPVEMRPQSIEKSEQLLACVHKIIREGVEAGIVHCRNWRITAFAVLGAMNWIPMWYSPRGELSVDEIVLVMEEFIFRAFGIETNEN